MRPLTLSPGTGPQQASDPVERTLSPLEATRSRLSLCRGPRHAQGSPVALLSGGSAHARPVLGTLMVFLLTLSSVAKPPKF